MAPTFLAAALLIASSQYNNDYSNLYANAADSTQDPNVLERTLLLNFREDCDQERATSRALNEALAESVFRQPLRDQRYQESLSDLFPLNFEVEGDYPAYRIVSYFFNKEKQHQIAESVDSDDASIIMSSGWSCSVHQKELKHVGISVISLQDCPLLDPVEVKSIFLENDECISNVEFDSLVEVDGTFDPEISQTDLPAEVDAENEEFLSNETEPQVDDPNVSAAWQYWIEKIMLPDAWKITTGSQNVVVGVIDSGVSVNHPDLRDNIWVNTREIPNNGIDDDGNGFIDDVNGYDFFGRTGAVSDDHGHGTHVAGIIGAISNQARGTAGVCQKVKIAALRFMDSNGMGATSSAIEALNYAVQMKFKVTNNSWGSDRYSELLYQSISRAKKEDQIFVAAAGNRSADIDRSPHYPAAYKLPNVLTVAATDENDAIARFSNTGANGVHIAAPGKQILSTFPPNTYRSMSGTSMASPVVAGVLALSYAVESLSADAMIKTLLDTSDKLKSLKGLVSSKGRVNAKNAVYALSKNPYSIEEEEEKESETTF